MAWLSGVAVVAAGAWAAAEMFPPLALTEVGYHEPATENVVAKLAARVEAGETRLDYHADFGYLPSLLKALQVPVSSQALVFSKTSFQAPRISPRMPRAIYHTPDVYVGWVRGGDVVEIAAVDAVRGMVFYTLDQERVRRPKFERRGQECLQCHLGSATLNVPGLVVRSVEVTRAGMAVFPGPSYLSGTRSKLEERWGGWYVTGTHGSARHMGNVTQDQVKEGRSGLNRTSLESDFNTLAYLSPHSDLVSLLVLEHQTDVTNLLVRALFEARVGAVSEGTVAAVAEALALRGQATWLEPVRGTTSFAREYAGGGLDLRTKLFRGERSPMMGSALWRELPAGVRERIVKAME
jgi:hypothetical protein